MIKNSKHLFKMFSKRLLCKHDYRPYCVTESREEFERVPYPIRKIMEKNFGTSADYEKGDHMWVSGCTRICIKCGKKIRKWNPPEERCNEIERLKKLGLETNKPNL